QVTRVAGKEITPGQDLVVPPAGDIEGTVLVPPDPYSVRAESLADDGYAVSQSARSTTTEWLLPSVRFRRPENPGETRATVTIEAGTPPDAVPLSVRVRVPAPRVRITRNCAQPGSSKIEGTAESVLEQEEQIWVEIRDGNEGSNCLYAAIGGGRWSVDCPAGYRRLLGVGLVAQPPGGRACPDGKQALALETVTQGRRETR